MHNALINLAMQDLFFNVLLIKINSQILHPLCLDPNKEGSIVVATF